ncbi:hypothetical protein [Paludisphaera sp.]|uniref:hypothetical protein n=1 Tax=Paludisphaera sp. TaxID=2017432 RepID=UPI00301D2AE0
MIEERETANRLVYGFLGVVIVAFVLAVLVRQPSRRVTVNLTHPSSSMRAGIGN